MAIAHSEGSQSYNRRIVDAIRERKPPFDPLLVTREFCMLMATYGISTCTSDRYGGEWVVQAFKANDIHVQHSSKSRSEIYLDVQPQFSTGLAEIPPDRTLTESVESPGAQDQAGRPGLDRPSPWRPRRPRQCGCRRSVAGVRPPVREPRIWSLGSDTVPGAITPWRPPSYARPWSGER